MARTKQTARVSTGMGPEQQPEAHEMHLSSGGVFSETLHSITKTKLKELSKKRFVYEEWKSGLLVSAQLEPDQRKRLGILVAGVRKSFPGIIDPNLFTTLETIERFLEQGRFDPSVTYELMLEWEQSLTDQLNVQSSKFQYASLYGELVTEWLSEDKAEAPAPAPAQGSDPESSSSVPTDDAKIREKESQRTEWERYVFTSFETDQDAIEKYLHSLFGKNVKKEAFKALEELREAVIAFESSSGLRGGFSRLTLNWAIGGLLSSKLLTDEKREVLKDFTKNDVVLDEIADVLNMRLAALETWEWEGDVTVDQRRHVSGRYEIYMHEDLLQAIFLQYIGVKWSVFFKSELIDFTKFDGAWTSLRRPISKLEKRRREYYLGAQSMKPTVVSSRQSLYHSHYFLSMLLSSEHQEVENIDGEEEVEMPVLKRKRGTAPRKQLASKAARKSAPSTGGIVRFSNEDEPEYDTEIDYSESKNMMDLKQSLLHLLSAEIIFNNHYHGGLNILHSQFECWNQSLPHSTILLIMAYFGVSARWISFFQKFLKAPLRFEDESSTTSRTRQRGVPEGHVLSDVFSELVMFSLDYAVNQSTNGQQLYRMQDDLWFWSPVEEVCVNAWKSITTFAGVMGVALNEEKTGSARSRDYETMSVEISPTLPAGPISWGFLILKQGEDGNCRFVIDQSIVSEQIAALKEHLFPNTGKRQSIFTWIKAWNTYASKFFSTNFGIPAYCYGREHVDDILSTLQRMQSEIFADHGGSVTSYLKSELQERFGVTDVPDGFLYFATHLGGLELHSPFIPFISIRKELPENPYTKLQWFDETEKEYYKECKDDFDRDRTPREGYIPDPRWKPENIEERDEFFSFEEFKEWREEFSTSYGRLADCFDELRTRRDTQKPLTGAMNMSSTLERKNVDNMGPYEKWVVQLYGPEMKKRFGDIGIADKGWLPVGMVSLFKDRRLRM